MTITRMATPRGPIPVTVDTFEASGGTGGGGDTMGGGGWECGAQTHMDPRELPSQGFIYKDSAIRSPTEGFLGRMYPFPTRY